ncbi:FAD-binding and (Fe-S)-binding domain-containing protein [Streptomyces sp. WMMB 322]|uniref:FAD-binding and (Fe-S)-binding domain-containing protein n=1 Tax=Streptomyces sp. WMMB 322 TaxID=1286821 RepID=UPI0006E3E362|nr:FAD-binding and (Fe-S)-binding domain-containing protein [Streptomyces sp. WMMB 322]SCK44257.1 FAD/FMN-containing dehydrogenase [Streptomyces sp. WMMB 322]
MTAISGDAPSPAGTAETARHVEARLRGEIEGDVLFDEYTRHLFSRDASMYAIEPLGVVFPRHAGDVQAAVTAAAEAGIPVVPRGAGTSLAGQTVGPGLVLDLSRHMNRIVEIDPEGRTALVEAGVVQDQLNRAAAAHGLMFGPDTSTSNRATIGGMIGNNSAGSGSIRYGMTIDHVRELDVVLSDSATARLGPVDEAERGRRAGLPTLEGRLYRELPRIVEESAEATAEGMPQFWRRACGYRLDRLAATGAEFDLAKFVVGSEGTLVLATRALVDLVPKPSRTVIAVGHFTSVAGAIAATDDALACDPSAVEMMDRTILDLSRKKIEYASLGSILEGDPEALLFVSFTGDDEHELAGRLQQLTALWQRHGHGYHTLQAVTPAQQGSLLKVRKSSLGLLMAASEGTRRPLAFIEDTAVDPVHLGDYTRRFKQVLDRHGLNAGFYGHCSVGCLHIRPFVDTADPVQVATMRSVAEEIKDLVREYGGVNSSEHGDGLARSEFNREIFGDDLYEAMRRVKGLFDPDNRLNPGKIVDAPSMTDNLRDPALPPAGPLRTRLDFEVVGGMRGAADRCMNIGLCRKAGAGTMCPSYMATLKEEDSTRGRANALVKALSEPDPHRALGDGRLHEVLDLCLMCKACKSECPLGVDMATLKAESLSHHHDEHGIPRRSRVFASIRRLNRIGSATAPLSNLPGRVPFLRALMDRYLGITPARPLPAFVRGNLVRWFRRRGRAAASPATATGPAAPGSQGTVTYLADSFTTYTEPGIGRAAVELLELAGWHVTLESRGCCGRSAFSKGLLDEAKDQARKLTKLLAQNSPAGSPVVGCEPSCLMTLRDEHRAMLPQDPAVADVSARVRQAEELLAEAVDDGRLRLSPDAWPAGRRILYHGHCHQKAEVGTAATVALLKRIPGAEVVELDAGCCGMAGSFGFESEHYETSMTVGSDRLFPAVRAEDDTTVIAASGVSCRQQIFHGTERNAWHPVELVRAALLTGSPDTGGTGDETPATATEGEAPR